MEILIKNYGVGNNRAKPQNEGFRLRRSVASGDASRDRKIGCEGLPIETVVNGCYFSDRIIGNN